MIEKSPTFNQTQEIFLSDEDYFTVTIPPLIWNGFKAIQDQPAIITVLSAYMTKMKLKEKIMMIVQ